MDINGERERRFLDSNPGFTVSRKGEGVVKIELF